MFVFVFDAERGMHWMCYALMVLYFRTKRMERGGYGTKVVRVVGADKADWAWRDLAGVLVIPYAWVEFPTKLTVYGRSCQKSCNIFSFLH